MMLNHILLKMPKDYDRQLWCNSCQAIIREMLIFLNQSNSEMDVDTGMSAICRPERFNIYDFPPPKMYTGCIDFVMEHNDLITDELIARKTNKGTERRICYELTKACIDEEVKEPVEEKQQNDQQNITEQKQEENQSEL